MTIAFTKMHGLGNDFVVIDAITQRVDLDRETIARLGDRQEGIGFDQLLMVETPDDPEADFRYRIYNNDGTEAEQCGNGARCFARFVRDQKLTTKRRLVLQTGTGHIVCEVHNDRIEVDMGEPGFRAEAVPFLTSEAAGDGAHGDADPAGFRLELTEGPVQVVPVSMGNPHAVIFVDDVSAADVDAIGAAVQQHPAFPQSVNVGFCEIVDAGFVRLRVYERVVGETRACGSGACAAVAAGVRAGRLGDKVKVSLPGGKLRIVWQGPGHGISMSGPAAVVFEGRFEP